MDGGPKDRQDGTQVVFAGDDLRTQMRSLFDLGRDDGDSDSDSRNGSEDDAVPTPDDGGALTQMGGKLLAGIGFNAKESKPAKADSSLLGKLAASRKAAAVSKKRKRGALEGVSAELRSWCANGDSGDNYDGDSEEDAVLDAKLRGTKGSKRKHKMYNPIGEAVREAVAAPLNTKHDAKESNDNGNQTEKKKKSKKSKKNQQSDNARNSSDDVMNSKTTAENEMVPTDDSNSNNVAGAETKRGAPSQTNPTKQTQALASAGKQAADKKCPRARDQAWQDTSANDNEGPTRPFKKEKRPKKRSKQKNRKKFLKQQAEREAAARPTFDNENPLP